MSEKSDPKTGGDADRQETSGRHLGASEGGFEDLHRLITATLEDPNASEHSELAERLATDRRAQDLYVDYIQDTSALRAHALCEIDDGTPPTSPLNRGLSDEKERLAPGVSPRAPIARSVGSRLAIAAGLLLMIGGALFSGRWLSLSGDAAEIATIVRVTDVAWHGDDQLEMRSLSRISSGQSLEFESGQLEIVFDTGVELLVTGPAAMSIDSPLRVSASRGAYTARVGERGKGFTIDTPATSVTDLGTEFGVSIQSDQKTGVVVFDGAVDVTPSEQMDERDRRSPIRLTQGEALAVSRGGDTHRIVAMYAGEYPTAAGRPGAGATAECLFEDVTDNLTDSGSKKFYRVVPRGFGEDARAFVDRGHEWNGIDQSGLPEFLLGGDYVMPFNDNKFLDGLEVAVRLRSACDLFVLFDKNMAVPGWLRERFEDTGYSVGLDHGGGPFTEGAVAQIGPGEGINDGFSVWKRRVEGASEVVLGGAQMPTDKELGWNMYGVVAVAPPNSGAAQ